MKVALVVSPGGHFYELSALKKAWEGCETFWVTIRSIDTESILENEKVFFAFAPTTRNIVNLIKNLFLAVKVIIRDKPDVIVSTGGPVCIPFFYIGRILRVKCIYIESLTRITNLSLTGKLVYPVASTFLVQWESLAEKYRKAQYKGQLML